MALAKSLALWGACLVVAVGCSQKTKVETKEALDAAGEAVSSAAQDTKENAKKAADVLKAAGDKAKEEFSGSESDAPAEPASTAPAEDPATPPPAEPASADDAS
jgi:hypothetical protein